MFNLQNMFWKIPKSLKLVQMFLFRVQQTPSYFIILIYIEIVGLLSNIV